MSLLTDPRWREAFALGVATGLLRYFDPDAPPPLPRPDGLRAENLDDGRLRVAWRPTDGADDYRLYSARWGRAWDGGLAVAGAEVVLEGLEPRGLYAFRVAARNASGEGPSSQAVVARVRGALQPAGAPAEALVVHAFDRWDAWIQEPDNDLCHAIEHGEALAAVRYTDLFFDGALDEVVEDGTVLLDRYALVDVVVGKDSTEHLAVSPAMQDLLTDYRDAGGALLVSGEEIGWQLVERSDDPADEAFLRDVLGAVYVADDAQTYRIDGVEATPFAGLEDIALERAMLGTRTPIVSGGEILGHWDKPDNALLRFLLQHRLPQRYGVQDLKPGHPVYESIRAEVLAEQEPLAGAGEAEVLASLNAKLEHMRANEEALAAMNAAEKRERLREVGAQAMAEVRARSGPK